MSGSVEREAFLTALGAASAHTAGATDGLPVLTMVRATAADGRLTFAATDRYTLGRASVALEGSEEFDVLLSPATVKGLLAEVKSISKALRVLPVSVEDGRMRVGYEPAFVPAVSSATDGDAGQFPKTDVLIDGWAAGEGLTEFAIKPAQLFRFTRPGPKSKTHSVRVESGGPLKTMRVTWSPPVDGVEFVGLIMPVRLTP